MDNDFIRQSPLAMDGVTFRALGHRLVDQIATFLESLPRGPVTRDESYVPRDLRTKLGDPAVERHLDALNRELFDRLQRGGDAFVSNAIVAGHYVLRPAL